MKKLAVLMLTMLMVLGFGTAASAMSIEIDFYGGSTGLAPGDYDTGKDITLDWTKGDWVGVDIVASDVPAGDGVAIYSWVLTYDGSNMDVSGLVINPVFNFVFSSGITATTVFAEASTSAPPDGEVVLASFIITCTATSDDVLSIVALGAANNLLAGGTNFSALYPGDIATIHQVPIPGAAWLLGSGLLGLVAIRRKKKS